MRVDFTQPQEVLAARQRLEQGVQKIASAAVAVAELQKTLAAEQVVVEEAKAATMVLIQHIGQEKALVDEAVESSREDEAQAAVIQAEAAALQTECSADLAAAEPVIQQAEAALNSLDKASLGELKSFGSPSEDVVNVLAACMVLCAPQGNIPKVTSG